MAGIAIVTGGGTNIGRSAALALAGAGWDVVVAGRRQEPLDDAVARGGERVSAMIADVTDEASVDNLFAQTVARFGRIDLLFNNAGVMAGGAPIAEFTTEAWLKTIATNVTGSFLCARAAFRQMAAQKPMGGRIINNGSISAYVPRPNMAAYTTSKHAVTGLTRQLSLEGRAYDIACGQIDIGNSFGDLPPDFAGATMLQADGSQRAEPIMDVVHIGEAVLHMAQLPLDANVQFMTIMATKMPYIGRG